MLLTHETQRDIAQMTLILAAFISILYLISQSVSHAIGIHFDHARHLVAALATVSMIVYVCRDLLSTYKKIFIGMCSLIVLTGAYETIADLYVRYFTILGMGDLPSSFKWTYLFIAVSSTLFTVFFAKKDLQY